MATVINNPGTTSTSGGWSVAIIALAIIVLGILAFFAFGGAHMGGSTTQVNIPAPSVSGAGTGNATGQ